MSGEPRAGGAPAGHERGGASAAASRRTSVLGFPLDVIDLGSAARWVLSAATAAEPARPRLVVTLNPEIVVQARKHPELAAALLGADLSVADGVGVALAARRAGTSLPGRVPGIDLAAEVMRLGGAGLRVYFLGGKPGVAERAAAAARQRFGVAVAGHQHGYFDRRSESGAVCAAVRDARADLLLAGLGEGQELFLARHAAELGAKAMMGVGGTLDVLAGEVKRMPAWTTRLGLEWLFRVTLDRRRWKRVPRLFEFAWLALTEGGRSEG